MCALTLITGVGRYGPAGWTVPKPVSNGLLVPEKLYCERYVFFSFHLLYIFLTDPYSILTGSFFLPRIVFHIGGIRKQERVLNMLKCVYMEL